ncbi:MAG: helix-turn-helix domain-containing protein [Solirubrobacteraceae bacterium]
MSSLMLLRSPDKGALHMPWLERVSGRLSDLPLGLPLALAAGEGYIPDFLTPPPTGPLASIGEELALVRATPRRQVNHELSQMDGVPPPIPSLPKLVDTLEAYWHRALEPDWPRIRSFLQADISYRARLLAEAGPARLFQELHPAAQWHGDHMSLELCHGHDIDLAGRGLLLVPSAFLWQKPKVIINEPWQPTLLYPARGIGTLWDEPAGSCALESLLGTNRAAVLEACEAPRSTTDIARRLSLTAGGVSQHLKVLRSAGLVCAERVGREVLYVRSEAADTLLSAAT